MTSETPFESLDADLTRLIPTEHVNRLDPDCLSRFRYDCLELFADQLNRSVHISNHSLNESSFWHPNNMCQDDKPQTWVTERAYVVALTMAILGCVGLAGNIMSCVVIAMHLLRFSGTFVLFLFLSMSDSLVVVMQIVDAYRNFVAVSHYTKLQSESELTESVIRRRDWSCRLFLFFWHFALQLSAWLVMALSVDRYASLRHIHFIRSRPFLYRRAWIIVLSLVTVLILLNSPFLLFVRSTVIKTHCSLNQFCIFGGIDKLWPEFDVSTELNHPTKTVVSSGEISDAKNSPKIMSILEAVESPTARWISLWLSRQHLLVFGIIPYAITFIFNMILIHYLRSCPSKTAIDPVISSENNEYKRAKSRASHNLMRKCCNALFRRCCYDRQRIFVKRKSTTNVPLMGLTAQRCKQWGVAVSNNRGAYPVVQFSQPRVVRGSIVNQGRTKEAFGVQSKDTNTHNNDAQPAIFESHIPASVTVLHESSTCAVNRYATKHFPLYDRHLANMEYTTKEPSRPMFYDSPANQDMPTMKSTLKPLVIKPKTKSSHLQGSGFWIGQKRTTILLLVVTFTFIGLTLPYHIYVELEHFHKVNKGASTHYDAIHAADDLCRFLLFLNNCLNFIVYMTGRQFRKGFFLVLRRMRQSTLNWIFCRTHQSDGQWHRHPPHQTKRKRQKRIVLNQKHISRLILEANQSRPRMPQYVLNLAHHSDSPLAEPNLRVDIRGNG